MMLDSLCTSPLYDWAVGFPSLVSEIAGLPPHNSANKYAAFWSDSGLKKR